MNLIFQTAACVAVILSALPGAEVAAQQRIPLGILASGAKVTGVHSAQQGWGLRVEGAGLASVSQPQPAAIEFWLDEPGHVVRKSTAYGSLTKSDEALIGKARLTYHDVTIDVEDRWRIDDSVLRLTRNVHVAGHVEGGFLSEIALSMDRQVAWPEVEWFAPGMIYGGFDYLTETAFGGRRTYRPGEFILRIREDRLPAPLLAGRFRDGATLAVLDPAPKGDTTAADGLSVETGTMIDERFQFGAVGAAEKKDSLSLGFWFPGSEGPVTYQGNTYPGGQLEGWRRRYHPIRDGFQQHYEVAFRFGNADGLIATCRDNWRWAWKTIQPRVHGHDIGLVRQHLVDHLGSNVRETDDLAGVQYGYGDPWKFLSVMGFCGKSLEAAEFMLAESRLDHAPRGDELRRKAEKIITSFLRIKMAPPEGEGFNIQTGEFVSALIGIGDTHVYLRSYGDDLKALLRAYEAEKQAGRHHPEWLAWVKEFADWLLSQQQAAGGFPRSWIPGTGEVHSDSPNSSYNAIPLLVLMHGQTGENRYLDAALRAADFCWTNDQDRGRFIGGTIDNPDVLDKEAATLSLEAYLAIYESTGEDKWLIYAKAAADNAETWIYIWDVPMPEDADDSQLHWKHGVPTTGSQLISTGHSLTDQYMAFDVDEYARLYRYTGDEHYLAVARLLLHNTKVMISLPGREFGPLGWQQEHFSHAPRRGMGLHQWWLPWVTTSHLNGIFGLMDFDQGLYQQLANPEATTSEK